nr:uncharacterized protein LOC104112515 [Nicotiana tomentosiformis]
MMIPLNIQKEIVNACAKETMKAIVEEMNGDYFGILVDESKDVSHKEQMALVLRYLLQRIDVDQFFDIVANVLNTIGSSFKRREMLREDQAQKLEELLMLGEVIWEVDKIKNLDFKGQEIPVGDLILRQCLSELNSRFDAVNNDLLLGMASLSPDNSFANYDKERIMNLAKLYPHEYSISKLEDLSYELDNYILYVREDRDFSSLKGLGDLSEILVETELHKTWGLVYFLMKLSLILPVATATIERAFSSMKYIRNNLQSRIGDEFINDCLVCYIEDEIFESLPNDAIIDRFQNTTSRRAQL